MAFMRLLQSCLQFRFSSLCQPNTSSFFLSIINRNGCAYSLLVDFCLYCNYFISSLTHVIHQIQLLLFNTLSIIFLPIQFFFLRPYQMPQCDIYFLFIVFPISSISLLTVSLETSVRTPFARQFLYKQVLTILLSIFRSISIVCACLICVWVTVVFQFRCYLETFLVERVLGNMLSFDQILYSPFFHISFSLYVIIP